MVFDSLRGKFWSKEVAREEKKEEMQEKLNNLLNLELPDIDSALEVLKETRKEGIELLASSEQIETAFDALLQRVMISKSRRKILE